MRTLNEDVIEYESVRLLRDKLPYDERYIFEDLK